MQGGQKNNASPALRFQLDHPRSRLETKIKIHKGAHDLGLSWRTVCCRYRAAEPVFQLSGARRQNHSFVRPPYPTGSNYGFEECPRRCGKIAFRKASAQTVRLCFWSWTTRGLGSVIITRRRYSRHLLVA